MSDSKTYAALPIVKAELGFSMEGRPVALLVDSAGAEWTYAPAFGGFDKSRRKLVYVVEVVSTTSAQQVIMYAPWRALAGIDVAMTEPAPLPGNELPAPADKPSKKGKK